MELLNVKTQIVEEQEELTSEQWKYLTKAAPKKPNLNFRTRIVLQCCGFTMWRNDSLNISSFSFSTDRTFCPSCGKKIKENEEKKEHATV